MTRRRPVSYATADDTELAAGLAGRDSRALAEAYRRHHSYVVHRGRTLLSSTADVDDVAQEVFALLWLRPAAFDPDRGSLKTFLGVVTRHRAVDRIRSDAARARREARDDPAAGVEDVAGQIEGHAVRHGLRLALDTLPLAERVAIGLAYFAGHSYREVAEVLGEPEGTVKSRIRSGLRRLRSDAALVGLQVAG